MTLPCRGFLVCCADIKRVRNQDTESKKEDDSGQMYG